MSDKFDTLHPKGDPSVNIYPNIKAENIPDSSIGKGKLSFSAQTQLYYHSIRVNFTLDSTGHEGFIAFHCITESATAFNAVSFISYLKRLTLTDLNRVLEVTGYEYTDEYTPIGVYADNDSLYLFYAPGDRYGAITVSGFVDTVSAL